MSKLTIESLQEKINEKADKRAKEFVRKLVQAMHDSGALELKDFRVTNSKTGLDSTMRSTFWDLDLREENEPLTLLYNQKYEQYVKEETKLFVENVNKLVSQTDDLLNIANNY
jgi:hypothetical protein